MQQVGDLAGFPVEFVLLVSDVTNTIARNILDTRHIVVQLFLIRQADLATDDHAVGGGKSLAGDPCFGFFGQQRIQNGVGNAVAHLIRVTLGNGFRGKDIVLSGHEVLH